MAYDGSLIFDTKIDKSGFAEDLKGIASFGFKAMGLVGTAIGAGAAAAIKVGSDFETGMSQVAAVSGATGAELELLTQKAEEMGAKTKFSATESAEALNYMAMAGWKTTDMLGGIEGIMNLAAASGESLAAVSDIVTDAMTAFGMSADESGRFADVLAAAASNSNTNVGMMGATFKYVAPIAGAMKYSIEDTAVAIGLMANAGIKGEQAGTSLRAMLTRLVEPPADAAAAMKELGLSVTNADGSMKPLNEVVEQLRSKFSGLSESQQASMASSLAGTEAMSGMLAIVNASQADFDKLSASIASADGTAQKMSDTMQDNLQGKLTILSSGLEGLGIAAYDKFASPLKEAVESAIDSVGSLTMSMQDGTLSEAFASLGESFGGLISGVATLAEVALPPVITAFAWIAENGSGIATAIAGVTAAVAAFKAVAIITSVISAWQTATLQIALYSAAMGGATMAQGLANGVFKASEILVGLLTGKIKLAELAQWSWNMAMNANPIGLVTGLVVGLIAVLGMLWMTNEEFRDGLIACWEDVKNFFSGFWDWIVSGFNALVESNRQIRAAMAENLHKMINDAITAVRRIPEIFMQIGRNIIDGLWKGFQEMAQTIAQKIYDFFENLVSGIKNIFGIHSPSRVFRDEIGKNLALGFGEGFVGAMPEVYRRMQAAVDAQTSQMSASVMVASGLPQQLLSSTSVDGAKAGQSVCVTNNNHLDCSNWAELNKVVRIVNGELRSIRQGEVGG